jgi:phage terminase small subunit
MTRMVVRVVMHRENLNPRQERFVSEYLKDGNGNGTAAAIRAGYATSSAAVQAHRLLKNEWILEEIQAHQACVQERNVASVDKTLREFEAIALYDVGALFDRRGNLIPPDKLPKGAYRGIERLRIEDTVKGGHKVRTVEIKVADRMAALNALAKRLGLFPIPVKRSRQTPPD